MPLKETLVKGIVFPLIDIATRSSVLDYLHLYRRSQWWSLKKLKELQEIKMRKMIHHAYDNVPYYRKTFKEKNLRPEDINNTEDLEKIPILNHENVRQHLNDLVALKSKGSLVRFQTGGTTGHPLIIYQDKNELSSAQACYYRGLSWCGYQIGEKFALVWGRRLAASRYAALKVELRRFLTRSVFIGAWDLSEEKLEEIIDKLNKAKPTFLRGYASPIHLLASFINQKHSGLEFHLNGVSTTAEPLQDFQRKEIKKAFNCEVFDQYGSTEVNSLGFECEEHMGLHVPVERAHIEFLSAEDSSPVSNGETGRIVVTCLENYGMPFIRYDTEDLGIRREKPCSCGRDLPMMDSIVGRKIDMIRLPNGRIVYGGLFVYALEDSEWITKYGIIQYQIVQKKIDHIILRLQSMKEPSQQASESFSRLLKTHLGDVSIDIEFVDHIPVSASGKRKNIISEVTC